MKKTKQKKKGRGSTILLVVIILAGLSLLLYPSVSNYWNTLHTSRAIADYVSAVANMDAALVEKCTRVQRAPGGDRCAA